MPESFLALVMLYINLARGSYADAAHATLLQLFGPAAHNHSEC